jgi:proteasome regulatory subunit
MRPGRFDRHVEIPLPDKKGLLEILKIHSRNLNAKKDIDFETLVDSMKDFSGADIHSCCQEAGMNTIKSRRVKVKYEDFVKAISKIRAKEADSKIMDTISYS